ncbi:tryptophan--tRNA ligase [bacterium]|nr:tryptophan--tRNA ligase [bacterium]
MGQDKKRILSGMRPTGRLHLGNYVGALENWIQLQNTYHSFHMVADWHMLTTAPEATREIRDNCIEVVIDWLSAGLDPHKSPLFVQSHVREHAELYLILSMLITVARLQRNPTVKEQARDLGLESNMSFGHLGYPVLQAADILLYKADAVPVGEDQAPHVEITREMAKRFNFVYNREVFPEPETILTRFARLPGLDGKKMSKSLSNSIFLSDTAETIQKKVMQAYTDPTRIRKTDPGHPEGCVVFAYHQKFEPGTVKQVECDCIEGKLGCVEHKRQMAKKLAEVLAPIQERRVYYESHRSEVQDIIADGDKQARDVASKTMSEVRQAMDLE